MQIHQKEKSVSLTLLPLAGAAAPDWAAPELSGVGVSEVMFLLLLLLLLGKRFGFFPLHGSSLVVHLSVLP